MVICQQNNQCHDIQLMKTLVYVPSVNKNITYDTILGMKLQIFELHSVGFVETVITLSSHGSTASK
jgi:hypothetical protein